jgi:hypothetical protein
MELNGHSLLFLSSKSHKQMKTSWMIHVMMMEAETLS